MPEGLTFEYYVDRAQRLSSVLLCGLDALKDLSGARDWGGGAVGWGNSALG
jgi:hypothetical protein